MASRDRPHTPKKHAVAALLKKSPQETFLSILNMAASLSVTNIERAVVQGLTDALRIHGVDVRDPDDSDDDGGNTSRYIVFKVTSSQ